MHLRFPFLITITCIVLLASCHPKSKYSENFALTTFSDSIANDSVDGAGCTFSINTADSKKGKDILAIKDVDTTERAFISVDGTWVELNETGPKETKGDKHAEYINHYSNEDFELTIDMIEIKQTGEEVSSFEGMLTLKAKSGRVITQHIIGECGA